MDEQTRLELLCEAVHYCQKVSALGMPTQCYAKALREPVFFLWEKHGRSKVAAAAYRSTTSLGLAFGSRKIVYDHSIPFRYLREKLLALQPAEPETVRAILSRFAVSSLLTKEEDGLLSTHGLARTMPADWDGVDPLARYRAVGIDMVPNPEHRA